MFTLALIGLVGGLITGISPCVLPVLPVVFFSGGVQASRTGPPIPGDGGPPGVTDPVTGRRPYFIVLGIVLSFSVITLFGTLALSALPVPKDIIRWAGLAGLVVLGIAMIFPAVQDLVERPFTRFGRRPVGRDHSGLVLGLALGAVYVPCAGPVLAAIVVAGATGRIGLRTVVLTTAFAVGAAIPLLIFALAGRGVAERVRAFRDRQRGVRIVAGLIVIVLAVALTFNVTDALQRIVPDYSGGLNKTLTGSSASQVLGTVQSQKLQACEDQPTGLQDCGREPAISGIVKWLNTPGDIPVTKSMLAGKVVLVDFWAYSCINCQRAIPHVEAWYRDYRSDGLVVIGVHTPEYAFEQVASNVAAGVKRLHITYPVALDNDYKTWGAFENNSWPAEYLVDASGEIRHVVIGEGEYGDTESLIRRLLIAGRPGTVLPARTDVPDLSPTSMDMTPETYLGADRAANNSNGAGPLRSGTQRFSYPAAVPANTFALTGSWAVGGESLKARGKAAIKLNFSARSVYLDIGGTGTIKTVFDGRSATVRVSGAPDIYPLVSGRGRKRGILKVTLSPGLSAYSFTFG
jgi:cytochrome c biogenesis protein CcdA/thiol-disulfide isomerase/thioredoxin